MPTQRDHGKIIIVNKTRFKPLANMLWQTRIAMLVLQMYSIFASIMGMTVFLELSWILQKISKQYRRRHNQ
jgi:hypothetical protein